MRWHMTKEDTSPPAPTPHPVRPHTTTTLSPACHHLFTAPPSGGTCTTQGVPSCPHVPQATSGSGSSSSQSPSSARRMSSVLRRGGRSASSRMVKRATVNAATTFSSAMAKLCPMQFLPPRFPSVTSVGGTWGTGHPTTTGWVVEQMVEPPQNLGMALSP